MDIRKKFKIVNNSVVTTNNVIDFDTGDVIYTLAIVGVDYSTRDPRKTGTMTMIVNIEPVNEFISVIHDQPLSINVRIHHCMSFKATTLSDGTCIQPLVDS